MPLFSETTQPTNTAKVILELDTPNLFSASQFLDEDAENFFFFQENDAKSEPLSAIYDILDVYDYYAGAFNLILSRYWGFDEIHVIFYRGIKDLRRWCAHDDNVPVTFLYGTKVINKKYVNDYYATQKRIVLHDDYSSFIRSAKISDNDPLIMDTRFNLHRVCNHFLDTNPISILLTNYADETFSRWYNLDPNAYKVIHALEKTLRRISQYVESDRDSVVGSLSFDIIADLDTQIVLTAFPELENLAKGNYRLIGDNDFLSYLISQYAGRVLDAKPVFISPPLEHQYGLSVPLIVIRDRATNSTIIRRDSIGSPEDVYYEINLQDESRFRNSVSVVAIRELIMHDHIVYGDDLISTIATNNELNILSSYINSVGSLRAAIKGAFPWKRKHFIFSIEYWLLVIQYSSILTPDTSASTNFFPGSAIQTHFNPSLDTRDPNFQSVPSSDRENVLLALTPSPDRQIKSSDKIEYLNSIHITPIKTDIVFRGQELPPRKTIHAHRYLAVLFTYASRTHHGGFIDCDALAAEVHGVSTAPTPLSDEASIAEEFVYEDGTSITSSPDSRIDGEVYDGAGLIQRRLSLLSKKLSTVESLERKQRINDEISDIRRHIRTQTNIKGFERSDEGDTGKNRQNTQKALKRYIDELRNTKIPSNQEFAKYLERYFRASDGAFSLPDGPEHIWKVEWDM